MVNTDHNQSSSTQILPKISEQGQVYYLLFNDQPTFIGHDLNDQLILAPASYEGFKQLYIEVLPQSLKAPARQSGWQISDLGTGPTITLNKQRLWGCKPLQLGDKIRLGQEGPTFVFESNAENLFSLRLVSSEATAITQTDQPSQAASQDQSPSFQAETGAQLANSTAAGSKRPFDLKSLFTNVNLSKISRWQIVAAIAFLGVITMVNIYQSTPPVTLPPISSPTSTIGRSSPPSTGSTVEAQNLVGQWQGEGNQIGQGYQYHTITGLILQPDGNYQEQELNQFASGGQFQMRMSGKWGSPTPGTLTLHLQDYAPKQAQANTYDPDPQNNGGTWGSYNQSIAAPYQQKTLEYGMADDGLLYIVTSECRQGASQTGCIIYRRTSQ